MVQWLVFCVFTAEGASLIPGWGTKILQAIRLKKKKKKHMSVLFLAVMKGLDFPCYQKCLEKSMCVCVCVCIPHSSFPDIRLTKIPGL